jgi:hypothetical protein
VVVSLIALKFITAAMIALCLLCLTLLAVNSGLGAAR